MSATGRTTWWPKDAAWHRRERIVELGEEFGPAGPNTMDVLCAWAQEQRAGGLVRNGFRLLAREAFLVTPSDARSILERACEVGAIDELVIEPDGRRFTCRISGWQADQQRGRAAFRMQKMRAIAAETEPVEAVEGTAEDVTEANLLRPVTPSPLPDLTKPEELHPPTPQGGNRQRSIKDFEQQVRTYTVEVLGIEHPDGWHNVKGAIQAGARTNDEVLGWLQQNRPDLLEAAA